MAGALYYRADFPITVLRMPCWTPRAARPKNGGVSPARLVTGSPLDGWAGRLIAALAKRMKPPGITLKYRQGLSSFGEGLSENEVRYIYSVLKRSLAA